MSILRSTQSGGFVPIDREFLKRRGYYRYAGNIDKNNETESWVRDNDTSDELHAIYFNRVHGKLVSSGYLLRDKMLIPDILSLEIIEEYWDKRNLGVRWIIRSHLENHLKDLIDKKCLS